LGENIFSIGRSREATKANTEYIFFQRRQYKVVLAAQNLNKFCIAILISLLKK
jgi:hypothetical protein